MSGTATSTTDTQREFLYKVLVVGEFSVGKTSIIRRYTEGYFSPNYKLTIGVDFALKTVEWDSSTRINLQLWDIAGHERFGHMTRVYYKYAIAAIVVFDLSKEPTFHAVTKWLEDLQSKVTLQNDEPVPVMLLANKCDLVDQSINTAALNNFCRQHNFIAWFPTSAKDDINIDESMQYLISHITSSTSGRSLAHSARTQAALNNSLILADEDDDERKQRSECCSMLLYKTDSLYKPTSERRRFDVAFTSRRRMSAGYFVNVSSKNRQANV